MSILNKIVRRVRCLIPDYIQYQKLLSHSKQVKPSIVLSKSVEIDLSAPQLHHRYLYTLIKFFLIQDYAVFFVVKFRTYQLISEYTYLGLILSEKNIYFIAQASKEASITLNDKNLTVDYFSACKKNSTWLPIPMPQHPLMYNRKLWDLEISSKIQKKRSIFMIGNFNRKVYQPLNQTLFSAIDRISVLDFLRTEKMLCPIHSAQEFQNFLGSKDDFKCIIIQRDNFAIPIEDLRYTKAHFSFFLALPGVGMPHCHNLIEAMSTGSIPIIHENYAHLMSPKLEHKKNALIYNSLPELKELIHHAYRFSNETIAFMTHNVTDYYTDYLSPMAVTNFISQNKTAKFALMAEHLSVNVYQAQMKNATAFGDL